ncbi:MAG TPA: RagB/SusD family nutrient uptake outer membrane protein [Bacteroidales bacterium]|nr:RagB/SusD family nutrient uptake outer membrane protein [Bacteroidales bacterium]HPT03419.1 RagB/SusD family nutrient uptake outer membrane protein [Bacteroidales bacterium]
MKILKYSIICLMLFSFASCEKFLDKAPLDSINTANFYQTKEDAIAAINGAYQPLQWPKLYNMRIWTTDIWAGNSIVGAGGATDGVETQDIANFVTSTDNAAALDIWRGPAPGILRCNLVLENVPGMDIDQNLKDRILGEAYFLRANYYFILVRLFGDVPLLTKAQTPDDDLRPYRTSSTVIYDTIVSDLKHAINLLPQRESYSGNDIGRASKGAAAGMLAKVYLTLGNYAETVTLCQQVTALGYTLNENYADNFDPLKKNSQESLFEVQYYGKTTYGFWDNENQASWLSTFTGPRNSDFVAGGYGWDQPTQEFMDQYEPGDKRKDITVLYEGCPSYDGKDYKASYSTTGYNLRKFLVSKSITSISDGSPANWPVLRYADVLLMEAEALCELNKLGEAYKPLNDVRQRAGLTGLSGLSQDDLRNAIRKERRLELAFEGSRWFDLIRYDNGQYAQNFFHSIGKTNFTSKFLLLPIPQKERDANPNLTQNSGY